MLLIISAGILEERLVREMRTVKNAGDAGVFTNSYVQAYESVQLFSLPSISSSIILIHSPLLAYVASTMATNWATELFGPKILTKPKTTGLPTESRLGVKSGKKLVALYFSASW